MFKTLDWWWLREIDKVSFLRLEKDKILRLKEKWRYLKPQDLYRDDEGEDVNDIIVSL